MFKMIKRMSFVIGIILVLILSFSYGTFIYTSDSYRTTEMLVSNLTYGIDITSSDATISGKTVSVSSGTTAVVYLKVTSLNKIDTKYGIDYKITKGNGTVKYASNTGWLPTGKISENNVGTYEKVVKVVIAAETDMSVDFTVTGGFTNNELTEVETGYTRITEKADNVISYNDTLTNVVKKETTNNIYGGESTNNYAQYPINEDNTKNIWRILGTYNGIGTKIVFNQVSTTTKSTLSTDLTSFYNTLEKPDNYILATDKFACTNTSCTSSSYSKVGLISTSEYEMLGGINSYLASSESYFALDNGTIKNITSGGIEETSTTSGLRPAVYLQDYVTVTGSGTVSDPFKLKMPEYVVVLNVVNGSATLPSKMITRGENATYEITPNTGYKLVLSSNTCSNGTLSGNTFTISNVTSAQSCTITLTPESYTLTFDPNGGYFGNPTEIDDGFSDVIGLPKGESVPVAASNTLNLKTNQQYMLSFDYIADGNVTFQTDLYPDTLPEIWPQATTSWQTQNWIFSSTSSDMSNSQIRYFSGSTVPNPYTITIINKHLYECNDCSTTSTLNVEYSSTYGNLPTPKRPGWTFTGWYTSNGVKVESTTIYNNASNTTITARWGKIYYTVTLNGVNGTTYFSPAMSWHAGCENSDIELIPNSGYTSEGATISCDGGATSSISGGYAHIRNVYQNQTCTVNFKKLEYNVTLTVVNGSGGGTQTVNHGSTATFIGISPNSGYSSSNPTVSCTGGSFSGTTLTVNNVTSTRTCTVTFARQTLAELIKSYSTTNTNGVYNENGYRYEGADPNNYIYMINNGTRELWRIIGVFPDGANGEDVIRVRKYYTSWEHPGYPYDNNKKNHYPTSTLYSTLKSTFSVSKYTNTVTFKMFLGGMAYSSVTANESYNLERGETAGASANGVTSFIGEVGLIYPSDLGYAALSSECARTTVLSKYNNHGNATGCKSSNWLHLETAYSSQWLITPDSQRYRYAFWETSGSVDCEHYVDEGNHVAPVMALSASVTVTGSGTQSDPYVMN